MDPANDTQHRRTTRHSGHPSEQETVGRLLKGLGFRLRVNRKQIVTSSSPDRNQQFLYIGAQRELFATKGLPIIISADAKKKELIGNFKNGGTKWDRQPILVKDHDFGSEAQAMVTPLRHL